MSSTSSSSDDVSREKEVSVHPVVIDGGKQEEPFDYDGIMENHIGQLGKYQLRIYLLLFLPVLSSLVITMSYSFIGGVPNYRYEKENNVIILDRLKLLCCIFYFGTFI